MNSSITPIPDGLKASAAPDFHQTDSQEASLQISVIAPVVMMLNELLQRRFLTAYAIGGGIAVLYYTEPVLTYDFDVICAFPDTGPLIDPAPMFVYLREQGCLFGKEDRIVIAGVPVQFIPASAGLVTEALQHAAPVIISNVPTRILAIEYLIAIMLQLYRPKDRAKLALLINNPAVSVNRVTLADLLTRYELLKKWERYGDVG